MQSPCVTSFPEHLCWGCAAAAAAAACPPRRMPPGGSASCAGRTWRPGLCCCRRPGVGLLAVGSVVGTTRESKTLLSLIPWHLAGGWGLDTRGRVLLFRVGNVASLLALFLWGRPPSTLASWDLCLFCVAVFGAHQPPPPPPGQSKRVAFLSIKDSPQWAAPTPNGWPRVGPGLGRGSKG